jgi:hypothetical protein
MLGPTVGPNYEYAASQTNYEYVASQAGSQITLSGADV